MSESGYDPANDPSLRWSWSGGLRGASCQMWDLSCGLSWHGDDRPKRDDDRPPGPGDWGYWGEQFAGDGRWEPVPVPDNVTTVAEAEAAFHAHAHTPEHAEAHRRWAAALPPGMLFA